MCSRSPSLIAAASDGKREARCRARSSAGAAAAGPRSAGCRLSAIDRVSSSVALRSEHQGRCSYFELLGGLAVQLAALGADAEELSVDLAAGDHPGGAETGRAAEVQPSELEVLHVLGAEAVVLDVPLARDVAPA